MDLRLKNDFLGIIDLGGHLAYDLGILGVPFRWTSIIGVSTMLIVVEAMVIRPFADQFHP